MDNRESIATIENFYDSNHIIKGWIFLVDVDSSQTEIYLSSSKASATSFLLSLLAQNVKIFPSRISNSRYIWKQTD